MQKNATIRKPQQLNQPMKSNEISPLQNANFSRCVGAGVDMKMLTSD